jgi:hypothetical protein
LPGDTRRLCLTIATALRLFEQSPLK